MNQRKTRVSYKGSGSIPLHARRGCRAPNCRAAWASAVLAGRVESIGSLDEPWTAPLADAPCQAGEESGGAAGRKGEPGEVRRRPPSGQWPRAAWSHADLGCAQGSVLSRLGSPGPPRSPPHRDLQLPTDKGRAMQSSSPSTVHQLPRKTSATRVREKASNEKLRRKAARSMDSRWLMCGQVGAMAGGGGDSLGSQS